MKKIIAFLLILICVVTFTSCENKSIQDYDEYCYKLNQIIKDVDFDKCVIQYGMISLLKDDEIVFETTFAEYDKRYEFKYIHKEDNRIFYVLNSSADDDEGIVFVNDDTNSVMDGLYSLERISGNSYKYKTYK